MEALTFEEDSAEKKREEEMDIEEQSAGVYVGLDIGQSQDYTAIVVLQHVRRIADVKSIARAPDQAPPNMRSEPPKATGDPIDEYRVRHAERLQLGTSYVEVIRHVSSLLEAVKPLGNATLILDATGVGAPIVDMFKAAGLKPVAVQVHGGSSTNYDKGSWHVPKRDLVSSAKRLLGEKTLKIADGLQHGDTLITELQNFHVKVNIATGHDTYEAWREGEHDDLVFAVSLACWWALRKKKDTLSIDASEIVGDTKEGAVHVEDDYRIGWIPARAEEYGVLAVYNIDHQAIVLLQRTKYESMQQQIDKVFQAAQRYEAAVRAQAGTDEAILKTLERRGAYVRRIDLAQQKLALAYENLSLLISYRQIKLPNDPELLVEFEIFNSYQTGQNSAVRALCLVTHDIHPLEAGDELDEDDIYYSYGGPEQLEGGYDDDYDEFEY
ncbi:MAG: hypothetical protein WBZ42_02210 [Halobacteriota archaeon]